eukprot:6210766-Pleurochrysis_carterae.AAC.1
MNFVSFEAGDAILRFRATGEGLYFVTEGQCEITVPDPANEDRDEIVQILAPGDPSRSNRTEMASVARAEYITLHSFAKFAQWPGVKEHTRIHVDTAARHQAVQHVNGLRVRRPRFWQVETPVSVKAVHNANKIVWHSDGACSRRYATTMEWSETTRCAEIEHGYRRVGWRGGGRIMKGHASV